MHRRRASLHHERRRHAAHRAGARVSLDLDAGQQPRCPHCNIVMRDRPGKSTCPECGYSEPHEAVTMPPEFDGPDFHDR